MGLSDEERLHGLYYSIDNLIKESHLLPDKENSYGLCDDRGKRLLDLIDQLWPRFLDRMSNGVHWIMGSSAVEDITFESESAWTTPIVSEIMDDCREDWDGGMDKPFNAVSYSLEVDKLLEYHQAGLGKVYLIFAYTESAVYYLRRYDDKLAASLSGLSDLICRIQGECFAIFRRNANACAKAYLLHKIVERLYTRSYPWNKDPDVVTKWLDKHHIHHHLPHAMQSEGTSLSDLRGYYVDLLKQEEVDEFDESYDTKLLRLEIALDLIGDAYHYEHEHTELIKWLEEEGWRWIDSTNIKETLKAKRDAHTSKEKGGRDDYSKRHREDQLWLFNYLGDLDDDEDDYKCLSITERGLTITQFVRLVTSMTSCPSFSGLALTQPILWQPPIQNLP